MIYGAYIDVATCKLRAYSLWVILFKLLDNVSIFFMNGEWYNTYK